MDLWFFVSDLHGQAPRYQKLFAAILAEESLMHGGFSMAVDTGAGCILEAGKAQPACAGFEGMAFITGSFSMVSG